MNKTAIKNFAVWARNKLIADISYRAGLIGITENGIASALPQSTGTTEFYDIGMAEPYAISGDEVRQRRRLVELIERKEQETDYKTAYKYIIEEVAYTWFNRLIAIRFMEVNDYLPSHIRVLSSESGKMEPDLVTTPFDAELEFAAEEEQLIVQLKQDNKLDILFKILFVKQCNALNEILPELFEKTSDYSELLLSISFTDKEGIVYKLTHDIAEDDFNIEKEGQVEIIGWMYQYYNIEPKGTVFARESGSKIKKEDIPAATQLFTPDWIVRYMVENSLGRVWNEGHFNDNLRSGWKYYLDEAEQEQSVVEQLDKIRNEYKMLNPQDIRVIDPCMGSGHILVYCFEILMQIYESQGYSQRDAAQSILENNIYGLDIDKRAAQISYFAVMMKARQYDRRILSRGIKPHILAIEESNSVNHKHLDYFGNKMTISEKSKAMHDVSILLKRFVDAKEYGSVIEIEKLDWDLLERYVGEMNDDGQMSFDTVGLGETQELLKILIHQGRMISNKYDVVVTNPPYMAVSSGSAKLNKYIKENYPDSKTDMFAVFIEKCREMTKVNGFQAMITMHSWMFISSYEKLRYKTKNIDIINLAHLGPRAFEEIAGEVVQTVSFVCRKSHLLDYIGTYQRLVDYGSQNEKEKGFLSKKEVYYAKKRYFDLFPGNPYVYWVGRNVIKCFTEHEMLDCKYKFREGIHTADNNRFLRVWFEVPYSDIVFTAKSEQDIDSLGRWVPYNKGGKFRKWYGNNEYVIGFDSVYRNQMGQLQGHVRPSQDLYYKAGGTWTAVASGKLGIRYYPEGYLFDAGGQVVVGDNILPCIAMLNTKVYNFFADMLMPTLNYKCGMLKTLPDLCIDNSDIIKRATENIELAKAEWDSYETSWDFCKHPLLCFDISKLSEAVELWKQDSQFAYNKVKTNEMYINQMYLDTYNLAGEVLTEYEDKDITMRIVDEVEAVKSFISYAVGCMFGRYSLDVEGLAFAGGEWDNSKYISFFPDKDNCIPIMDEEYFDDDIVGLFCAWLKKAMGAQYFEENLDFIAKTLGNKGKTSREVIRNYFLNDFFKEHCANYSVTGSGKRPIYWLFDSGKQNGFKALVYMHRWNVDTIGNIRVDYLHRTQRIYESEINRMQDMIDNSTNSREVVAATKRKEKLQKQLKECREYDEKIGHLALSRINIDLDDGFKINYEKVQTASDGKKYQVLAKI